MTSLLRASGLTTDRPIGAAGSLSRREQEVIDLVEQGLTNREIAKTRWMPARAGSSSIRARSGSGWTSRRRGAGGARGGAGRAGPDPRGRGIPALGQNTVRLAEANPGATLILAHAAISDLAWLWRVLPDHPNVLVDTAWWNPVDLVALFSLAPPANIVWASDSPYGRPIMSAVMAMRCALQSGLGRRADPRDRGRDAGACPGGRGAGRPRPAAGAAGEVAGPPARALPQPPGRGVLALHRGRQPRRVDRARPARLRGRHRLAARGPVRCGARATRRVRGRAGCRPSSAARSRSRCGTSCTRSSSRARRTCRCPRSG